MAWVYILRCDTGRYYIGSTDDIERRMQEHARGQTKSTRHGSWRLVFKQEYPTRNAASEFERVLKGWKSKKIIERIILDGLIKRR